MLLIWIGSAWLLFTGGAEGRRGFGPGEQEWGYASVRSGARIFWWLYYVTPPTGPLPDVHDRPLLIWLQGGPGASSTGYGNFEELGPLTLEGGPRNRTWINDYNVLFIDNPVGTGFSYSTWSPGFASTNRQIAEDLLECMRIFLGEFPGFNATPTYITAESYGGKMAAEFGLLWYQAQKAGNITSNLRGLALGDSWISPIDSVLSWGPYLLSMGMIDNKRYEDIQAAALATKAAVDEGDWISATHQWSRTEGVILSATGNIDFYNILEKKEHNGDHLRRILPGTGPSAERDAMLERLMNGDVRKALGVPSIWGDQQATVFQMLIGDFMKPVIHIVKQLIEETDLEVFVFTGHLDLIVATPGTLAWVERMLEDAVEWQNAPREPVVVENIIEGYVKEWRNFKMYWINRSGHMVPKDNPDATEAMLKHLTGESR